MCENGAGKSTLMKILAGAYSADAGEIVYKGELRDQAATAQIVDSGISIIYQALALALALFGADALTGGSIKRVGKGSATWGNPAQAIGVGLGPAREDRKAHGLFATLSLRINVTIPILSTLTRFGILKRSAEDKVVRGAQERLSIIKPSADQETQFLSGGNQQKVVLAKWLSTNPVAIILDEPTRGVDVGAKLEIYRLMRRLHDRGIAIVMITSELPEIIGMSDRIMGRNDGRAAGELTRQEAGEARIIELATMGAAEASRS